MTFSPCFISLTAQELCETVCEMKSSMSSQLLYPETAKTHVILHWSHWVAARIHISHVVFAPARTLHYIYSDCILSKYISYIENAVLLQVCISKREFFFSSLTDFLWSSNTSAGISGVPVKQCEDRSVRRKQIAKTSCWHLAVCSLRRGGLRISWHSVSLQSQSVFWKQTYQPE